MGNGTGWVFVLLTVMNVLIAIVLLSLAGGFVTLPFREGRRFTLLLAPMCGLLVLPPLVALVYASNKTTFAQSGMLALSLCCILTILSCLKWRPSRQDLATSLALLPLIAIIATGMFCSSAIHVGSPTILYIDGSDHGGYAQAADWLLSHPISVPPNPVPERPYESWLDVMFVSDFRYSAFVAIALMAALTRLPGLFAYDLTCAVAFSAACLSIAAVFARSRFSLVVLSLCLLLTDWFELGRMGYLGKLLGYPSCLFLLGLFLTSYRTASAEKMAAMALLTAGVATMHSGVITAFFVAGIGGLFICIDGFLDRANDRRNVIERFQTVGAIAVVAIASSGVFARPLITPGAPGGFFISWGALIPHFFEIQNPTRDYLTISDSWLAIGSSLAVVFHLMLVALAILRRNEIAITLTTAPLLIFLSLVVLDAVGSTTARFAVYQFSSVLMSLSLCGLFWLVDSSEPGASRMRHYVPLAVLGVALISVRLPRVATSFGTYVSNPPNSQIFKLQDFDAMAAAIGRDIVQVDLRDDLNTVASLDEFGRRGIRMQFTSPAWKIAVGYRKWPDPVYGEKPSFVLAEKRGPSEPQRLVFESDQYRLSRLP
jgi:hypothetical protein